MRFYDCNLVRNIEEYLWNHFLGKTCESFLNQIFEITIYLDIIESFEIQIRFIGNKNAKNNSISALFGKSRT